MPEQPAKPASSGGRSRWRESGGGCGPGSDAAPAGHGALLMVVVLMVQVLLV
jgi:hypothetical protein